MIELRRHSLVLSGILLLAACAAPVPPSDSGATPGVLAGTTTGPAPDVPPPANVFEPKIPKQPKRFNQPTVRTGELGFIVERIASRDACHADGPAQLMAKRPGVEFYRVGCSDARQVLVKCESRQCFIEN
jgi:hypothetical protein